MPQPAQLQVAAPNDHDHAGIHHRISGLWFRISNRITNGPRTGQLARGGDEFGTFYTYVPTTIPEDVEILVVIHGTPLKDQTEEWNAEYYATNWLDFAEEQSFVLVVPVFNQKDFSSRLGDHALSGYRGLFGREIGADEWVLRLADMATFAEANGLTSHFTIDIIAGKGHTMSGLIAFSQKGFGFGTRQRKLIA